MLAGQLKLAEFTLDSGGYAYLPPGNLGVPLSTDGGARILYFLDEFDAAAVIRTPLITDGDLMEWQELAPGIKKKELRMDPGSGARSWLLGIEPGAEIPWGRSTVLREGYLIAGHYRHSECFDGEPQTAEYLPGGYFHRPAEVVSGGPEATALAPSLWFIRELSGGETEVVERCEPAAPQQP